MSSIEGWNLAKSPDTNSLVDQTDWVSLLGVTAATLSKLIFKAPFILEHTLNKGHSDDSADLPDCDIF
jgi:hypothetical protein